MDIYCHNCKGFGRPNMCPVCYRVGQVKPVPKKKLTWQEDEVIKDEAKRAELKVLWDSLTLELWNRDRGIYLETIKKIKHKESILFH